MGIMRIVHAATVPDTLGFLTGQCAYYRERGDHVVLIASPGPQLDALAAAEGTAAVGIPMARSITPSADIVALARLVLVLRRLRPDVVHAHTPKAGLLVTIAARMARVPVSIYHIHGLRFVTAAGWQRRLLKRAEWLACALAHKVLGVSRSILDDARAHKVLAAGKGTVLRHGTVNGVDAHWFCPGADRQDATALRRRLGLSTADPVVGFVGRLVADKGIAELTAAWQHVRAAVPEAHLVLVGRPEAGDPVPEPVWRALREDPRVHLAGAQSDVRPYYWLMDVTVLPSRREGFGQVLLEAAACAVPSVASDIPGIRDAVVHGQTGLLFPRGDAATAAAAIVKLLGDPVSARRLGANGRARAIAEFSPQQLWTATREFDLHALQARHRRRRGPKTVGRETPAPSAGRGPGAAR